MKEKEIHDELSAIRNLMERSSKFISLSGLSGILAGVYALAGACIAYFVIKNNPTLVSNNVSFFEAFANAITVFIYFLIITAVVLIMSVTTAVILSRQKAKKNGQSMWGQTSRALLFHMIVPLLTGGLVIVMFLYQGNLIYVVSVMLIFYGLALVSASSFTFNMVKYLGLCEIALGLIAACLPGYGLLFWAFGFGVLHIIYGGLMYLKYDR